jgi:hypothetical protein
MNNVAKQHYFIAIVLNGLAIYVMRELQNIFEYIADNTLMKIEREAFYSYGIRWWPYAMFILSIVGLIHCFRAKNENVRLIHAPLLIISASLCLFMYSAYWFVKPTLHILQ